VRPPRFRTRTLMVAVAAVGVALGAGVTLWRRSAEFRQRALEHGWLAERGRSPWWFGPVDRPSLFRRWHHDSIRAKYERAARYPWLPVLADPPEPPMIN
jgi:hypothetical protein